MGEKEESRNEGPHNQRIHHCGCEGLGEGPRTGNLLLYTRPEIRMYHSHAYIHELHAVETRTARRWINSHAGPDRERRWEARHLHDETRFTTRGSFFVFLIRGTALSYAQLSADRPYQSIFTRADTRTMFEHFHRFCDYQRRDLKFVHFSWESTLYPVVRVKSSTVLNYDCILIQKIYFQSMYISCSCGILNFN